MRNAGFHQAKGKTRRHPMKSLILALSFATALSFALTCPASVQAAENAVAAANGIRTVVGTVSVSRDKSGKPTIVALKTENGSLLVPTKSIDSFLPHDGRKVKACCSVQGKSLIPICVTGIVQAQKIAAAPMR